MQILDYPISASTESPATDDMAAVLRQAIRRSGLTLDRISAHLAGRGHRLSRTTLSNWQRGHTVPHRRSTLAALNELETLLGLEPGILHADEPKRPAHEGMERAPVGGFETVSAHERHILGADGLPMRHETRVVIRPLSKEMDTYVAGFLSAPGAPSAPSARPVHPRITAVAGCDAGEVEVREGIVRVPLHFRMPVPRGRTHLVEFALDFDHENRPSLPEVRRVATGRPRQLLIHVVFHPERRPIRVDACRWDAGGDLPSSSRQVPLDAQGSEHRMYLSPSTGNYGLRWTFD
jgi:hypothetical protein